MARARHHTLRLPGGACLAFPKSGAGFAVEVLMDERPVARCGLPVAVMLFKDGGTSWHRAPYARLSRTPAGLVARAEAPVASSRLLFTDRYRLGKDHFRVERQVRVSGDSEGCGFVTAIEWDLGRIARDDPWFAPGVWYGTNEHVPDYAIGSPFTRALARQVMVREDRLPLPFMLHYDGQERIVFSMAHLRARAATVAADDEDDPLVDGRLGFGSLGMDNGGRTFSFWFPGSEAEVSYPPLWTLGRGNRQEDSPVNPFAGRKATETARTRSLRLHPLQDSFRQDYALRLDCRVSERFDAACDRQWRLLSAEYRPRVMRADLARVEQASVELLARMTVRRGTATGIPTWVDCFGGKTGRLQATFGIGFVSRNLEAARLLLSYGRRYERLSMRDLGAQIMDFWVKESGQGLSHTEYDPVSGRWVDSEEGGAPCVFLRDQSESRRACLQAWESEREGGVSRPEWLEWISSYGDWLIAHQERDGSFRRSYRPDGTPSSPAPADCSHVIPFLLALDRARGTSIGLPRALAAARFLRERFHERRVYIGATLDNPNCVDKESSALAFEAYLRLFEVTGDREWLAAAEDAARACETWMFQWNIPMPVDDPRRFFPDGRATTGFQLITTGFSAFDMYLTRHVGDYLRLARYTEDRHYQHVARLLLHNTKAAVQLRGERGYALNGMQIEHWSMGRGRGYGLNSGWLPWVATSHLVSIEAARAEL